MSVPVVSALTSILAPFVGQNFLYQPAATNSPTGWKEQTPLFAFTVNTTTDVITVTGAVLREGLRVRVTTAGTLPAPLLAGPWYYLRDVDAASGTAKLVDTTAGLINYPVRTITGGDETTDVITADGAHGFSVGDRVYFPALTGGSGLTAASAFYYVATVPTANTFTVSATLGGAGVDFTTAITAGTVQRTYVIDLTTAGSGTLNLQESALPLGLSLDLVLGTIQGAPEVAGVYEITLAAFNGDGDSADFIFPIGVRESDSILDAAIGITFDWDTGRISRDDGTTSDDPDKPLFAFKNGDQLIFAVKFTKGGAAFRPLIQYLTAAIKVEDEEAAIVLTSGAVDVQGAGSAARFYFIMDTTALADLISGALGDVSVDGSDVAKCWLELRLGHVADPLRTGTSELFYKASRSVPVNVERSLVA